MGILTSLRESASGSSTRELRAELRQERWQSQYLQESMSVLEDQVRDENWRRLSMEIERDFTRQGLDEIMRLSRAMYLSHPLIQRAVNVRAYYTWGQGVSITSDDERVKDEVIDPMMEDEGNKAALFGHQTRILTDIDQQVDGNTFVALFTDNQGNVSVRDVPAEEIREVFTDPDDVTQVWYYRRCWTERRFDERRGQEVLSTKEAFYPDWRYDPAQKPKSMGRIEVKWDSPLMHQRTGGLKRMSFGVPETYAALDWARAYRKFLEDWHTIVSSLARFAWRMTTKSSKVQDAKDRLGSTITPEDGREHNPQRGQGAAFIAGEGVDMTPIPKTGATTSADDAKPSRLMVAAAMDLPDTILSGDADQGNLATAKTLDRPTELAIVNRQTMWADRDTDIFKYAIRQKIKKGLLPKDVEDHVSVSFPPILEHDLLETVQSIVAAATLEGKIEAGTLGTEQTSRLLMQALGVEDIDQAINDLEERDPTAVADAVARLAAQQATGGGPTESPPPTPDPAAQGPPAK